MTEEPIERRLRALRSASASLGAFVESNECAAGLLSDSLLPDADAYRKATGSAYAAGGMDQLRIAKRCLLAQVAAWDVAGDASLEEIGRALSDLADACLETALQAAEGSDELAVIAMGKLGGRELNYVSDIDLLFVAEGDLRAATRAAEEVMRSLGGFSPQGTAFYIDVNLRPEGRSGALVRSLDAALEYYGKWARPWEHQALIKARAAAGCRSVAKDFIERSRDHVFPGRIDADRIASLRKVKARVETQASRSAARGRSGSSENVKLGPGGIRDIEFSVQLLQLVHGGSDPSVRSANTLAALGALVEGGYVAEQDGDGLASAYRWLRMVEHRLQLWRERRVHSLPARGEDRARLARSLGFTDVASESAVAQFESAHRAVLADVRGRFEKLFYRPMIESLSEARGTQLSPDALRERLRVLGFRDVDKAARTLDSLVSGTSRRAKLFRVLTPALLRWLAETPLPDEGLLSFLKLGESLGSRIDGLGALRDNPPGLAFLAHVLGSGRLLGDLLAHVPEELSDIATAGEGQMLKERERLIGDALASLEWRVPEKRFDGLRRFKRRELLNVALADLASAADVTAVGAGLANVADACLQAALLEVDVPLAAIGMGKLGGRELGYASDIDVVFVHAGDPVSAENAAEHVLRAIGELTPEGQAFQIDLDLRPEGRAGALTRSLDAFLEYYARWSKPWEHLALLKARLAAGNEEVGHAWLSAAQSYAYPDSPAPGALTEIRHLKARMEKERIPRYVDARRHLKLGPGGMSDVEFAVQLLQHEHAHRVAELRVTGTLEAAAAARDVGLLDDDAVTRLSEAWVFVARLRNALFLMLGRPVDVLPSKPETLEALGIAVGFRDQPRQEVEEHFLRVTRRARKVAERLIYGQG
jgi:glutamate-ammonia-ligase adenylyltransferase